MRILDWRPPGERLLTGLWRAGGKGEVRSPGFAGRWYGRVHQRAMARRVGRRASPAGDPLVVSIGNLALGGTGKTPVAIALARDLAALGHSGCVLTRGYRSPLRGPLVVEPGNARAGDEARLLATVLAGTGWAVVQARDRMAGLRHVLTRDDVPEIVLLEDGHQTADVGRACDVLILDHWTVRATAAGPRVVPRTGAVFPFGPWRESAQGAARAGIWLLETNESVPATGVGGSRVLSFSRQVSLRPGNEAATMVAAVPRAMLVSGIARPDAFERGASNLVPAGAVLAVRLPDHQPYGPSMVRRLERAVVDSSAGSLVTTAKDWVKLAEFWPATIPAYVVEMTLTWGHGETLPALIRERL